MWVKIPGIQVGILGKTGRLKYFCPSVYITELDLHILRAIHNFEFYQLHMEIFSTTYTLHSRFCRYALPCFYTTQ